MSEAEAATAAKPERTVPMATVVSLLAGALSIGGAGGTAFTGSTVAAEFREFRAEMRGDMATLRATLIDRDKATDRLESKVVGLEERLRQLEIARPR